MGCGFCILRFIILSFDRFVRGIRIDARFSKNSKNFQQNLINFENFSFLHHIYIKRIIKLNIVEMEYKRKYREMDDATKQKISQSLKGRSKSMSHKENIRNGLIHYWEQVPNKPTDGEIH